MEKSSSQMSGMQSAAGHTGDAWERPEDGRHDSGKTKGPPGWLPSEAGAAPTDALETNIVVLGQSLI